MLEGIYLPTASVLAVVIGTWLIGELSPKIPRRYLSHQDRMDLVEMDENYIPVYPKATKYAGHPL